MKWKAIKDKKSILLFLGLFLILIVASYYLTEPGPEEYPAYRVNSPAPNGTKAFYESLETYDFPTQMFYGHSNQLEANQDTAIILFNPPLIMGYDLIEGYQRFVDQGGTIYLFRDQPTELSEVNSNPVSLLDVEGEVSVGEQNFQAELFSWMRLSEDPTDQVLIEDEYGVIALERSIGQGQIIDFIEPSWLTNQHILANDHLHIINETIDFTAYNLLLFESYHYLDETSLTVLDVTPDPVIVFALILFVGSVLLIWMQGKRYGPARDLREQTVRFGDERIRALATWQIRGKNYHDALNVEVDYLKYVIFERTGTPITASWANYQRTLERLLNSRESKSVKQFIDELKTILESERITKKEFLEWTKRIDQMRREVEEE